MVPSSSKSVANQIVTAYEVYDRRLADSDLLIGAIDTHQARLGCTPRLVAAHARTPIGATPSENRCAPPPPHLSSLPYPSRLESDSLSRNGSTVGWEALSEDDDRGDP
jgi:hypothetical protein